MPFNISMNRRPSQNSILSERGKSWKNLVKQTRRFLSAENGPTAVEYAVLLAIVVIAALAGIRSLGITTRESFHLVGMWVGS